MPTRTIPKTFPVLRDRDYFTYRAARGVLLRNIAQAQNYLWSRAYRNYATMAYEGNGNRFAHGDTPTGPSPDATDCLHVSSFLCPPNWGPSARVKCSMRAQVVNFSGTCSMTIWLAVYELDGTYTGTFQRLSNATGGAASADVAMEIAVPRDREVELRVFIGGDLSFSLGQGNNNNDVVELLHVSARYVVGDSAEMGGDTPRAEWKAISHAAADNYLSLNSGLLVDLVRNTNHLYAMRPPELAQSWLGRPYANGAAFTEVGRYVVWVPSKVTQLIGRLRCFCTHGGAGNEVRVLLNGVVVQTFAALVAGDSEQALAAFAVTPNAEATITVEATSTAAAADWGTIVNGVWFYEEAVTLSLPAGTAIPAAYVPVDEDELLADDVIVSDLNGTTPAGLKKLLQNDTWLARHRLRWLVGDWRHRVVKRIRTTGGAVDPLTDWSPGSEANATGRPKNITVIGTSSAHNTQDGRTPFPNGLSTVVANDIFANQAYSLPGRRVGKFRTDEPTGTSSIAWMSGAFARLRVRARRLGTAVPFGTYTNAAGFTLGPGAEDNYHVGRASVALYTFGAQGLALAIPAGAPGASGLPTDREPQWTGTGAQLMSQLGVDVDIIGRALNTTSVKTADPQLTRGEGHMFEVEVMSVCLMDAPLTAAQLAALP